MQEAAFCCAKCDFHSESRDALEEHQKTKHSTVEETTHDDPPQKPPSEEQCPLCPVKCEKLRDHLAEEHKIAEEAIERLMLTTSSSCSDKSNLPSSSSSAEMSASETAASFLERHTYRFRCPLCPLAFRSEEKFLEHKLGHMFRAKAQNGVDEETVRCEICQEGFADKNALLMHYNSVGHLKKAKRFLEQQPNSLQLSPQVLAALQQPSPSSSAAPSPSTQQQKPFKCNVCRLGYGQGSTLDIHLRSVAHQARMGRVAELVAAGEIDPQKPVSEQPGGPTQKLIGDLIAKSVAAAGAAGNDQEHHDEKAIASSMDKQQTQSALSMLNMINMAQLFSNMQQQQQTAPLGAFGFNGNSSFDFSSLLGANSAPTSQNPPSSNGSAGATPAPPAVDEEHRAPRTGVALRKALEKYGLELVTQFNEGAEKRKRRLDRLPDEAVPEMAQVDCKQCQTTFSSIWVLKAHCEEVHQSGVPSEVVEEFSERLRRALDDMEEKESENDDSCEPPEPKRMREVKSERSSASSSPSPPKANGTQPDLSNQLAMMGMMGFPFLNNPFMPMMTPDFFQNIASSSSAASTPVGNGSASTSGSSPAKRARTRITDDQLKVLRQYFDINNSPSENQIKEMSLKAGLPEKVIKHWFRNTLFKERQRDKDSPYNFNVPPQVSIDLDTYEKTGEAKITPLKTESEKLIQKPSIPSPATPADLLSTLNKAGLGSLANFALPQVTVPSTVQQQNPFTAFLNNNEEKPMPSLSASNSASGRRANRTRFTDFQLRTLQQFFDKQAYPKDDDLELLSRRLQLSPRVIVVWFQNARQKARKIYENQPNQENNERFLKTPGCNFQCKRCQVVFQRYYELIQHQQKLCYKDDTVAQQKDNRSVEETLSDDEKTVSSNHSNQDCTEQGPQTTATATASVNLDLQGTLAQLMSGISAAGDPRTEELMKLIAGTSADAAEEARPNGGVPLDLSSSGGSTTHDGQRESLSMSPSMTSDNDDGGSLGDGVDLLSRLNDSTSPVGMFASSSSQHSSQRSPATNSKRYRTHLTPIQVHVMKSLFNDYKTPSMTECDMLGQEIGLHKRVVQVWFQNARAKERKARASNGDEELLRSNTTRCAVCSVEYSGVLTLQDHIFTHEHIQRVKETGNPRLSSTVSAVPSASTSSGMLMDDSAENRRKPVRDRKGPVKAPSASAAAVSQFPYNLMYGMQSGQLPMIFDPNIMGTPVSMLQIPETVMAQIAEDMQASHSHTVFTQDGKQFAELESALEAADFAAAQATDIEVGWACPQCSNVFQSEALLKNHQRMICQQSDSVFKLIQTHYECRPCAQKFGTQDDFKQHCNTSQHKSTR